MQVAANAAVNLSWRPNKAAPVHAMIQKYGLIQVCVVTAAGGLGRSACATPAAALSKQPTPPARLTSLFFYPVTFLAGASTAPLQLSQSTPRFNPDIPNSSSSCAHTHRQPLSLSTKEPTLRLKRCERCDRVWISRQ